MKKPEVYQVVIALPRENQQKLRNEQARRQLAGRPKQNLIEIASELLIEKLDEASKG